ncbi:MotA/TolQ/ExbB proton channel family protein [Methylobacterium sp. D48H]
MSTKRFDLDSQRQIIAVISLILSVILIYALYATLNDEWAHILLDRAHTFPYSVQNGMWIAFCIGLGELLVRFVAAKREFKQLRSGFLPEDDTIILQSDDLPGLYRNLKSNTRATACFLPRLISRCILQFQASKSTAESASLLNTSVEMFLHEVDLRYNMIRYICWVIPSLGFIGTVVGIGRALEHAGDPAHISDANLLTDVTGMLAVSFNGTFLALVMASILVLLQNIAQSKEEHALNLAGQYCLDNLVNRLYVADRT